MTVAAGWAARVGRPLRRPLRAPLPGRLRVPQWGLVWALAWALVGGALAGLADGARAQASAGAPGLPEPGGTLMRVKAAYLYRFGAFVEWPGRAFASPDSPVVIGVVDADALADELTLVVGGRSVQGRGIAVRRLHGGDASTGVHVLYVGRGVPPPPVGTAPLLTVADDGPDAAATCMICFVRVDGRLRFDVFPARAEAAGLVISARLLAVAHRIHAGVP